MMFLALIAVTVCYAVPTESPTVSPTINPTTSPTINPTTSPTINPTTSPTVVPTVSPTTVPSGVPSTSHANPVTVVTTTFTVTLSNGATFESIKSSLTAVVAAQLGVATSKVELSLAGASKARSGTVTQIEARIIADP